MRTIACTLAAGLLLSLTAISLASDCCCNDTGCSDCVACPNCKLKIEKAKIKKYCWEVECKPICIPKVRFPWQECCEPLCAVGRNIHVLKKVEYECEECKYVWTPEENGGCCGNGNGACRGNGCTDAGCGSVAPQLDVQPVPTPAAPVDASARLKPVLPNSQLSDASKVRQVKLSADETHTKRFVRLLEGMKLGNNK